MAQTQIDRLLGISEVELMTAKDRSTLAKWIATKRFPAPIFVGSRRHWTESTVREWLAAEQLRPRRRPTQLRHVEGGLEAGGAKP